MDAERTMDLEADYRQSFQYWADSLKRLQTLVQLAPDRPETDGAHAAAQAAEAAYRKSRNRLVEALRAKRPAYQELESISA